ncbi:MAG: NifB/NifX family molybdenum-iron cluster-binding protein [Eubacteriales bacterium]|nr:NifB/NifX family molybdenum-iron cluster-binding protein [Eubacteriales bacterium]
MKICITSGGSSPDSLMDPRFGRAPYFVFVDTDTMAFEAVENAAVSSGGGAGVASGQLMADKDIKAVITGNMGPNAMNVLKAADIEIYRGSAVSIKENAENFKKGLLEKIAVTGPSHYGMGMGRGNN